MFETLSSELLDLVATEVGRAQPRLAYYLDGCCCCCCKWPCFCD